jgi:hypothetical protein
MFCVLAIVARMSMALFSIMEEVPILFKHVLAFFFHSLRYLNKIDVHYNISDSPVILGP